MTMIKLPDEAMDKVDRKVRDDIARAGWSDIGVFPTKKDTTMPFNYTVGLVEYDHPDLVVMGVPNSQGHTCLTTAVKLIEDGVKFRPNTFSDRILRGFNVAFVRVEDIHNNNYPLSMLSRFYGEVSALQIIWPDRHGRFPWHADFEVEFQGRQVLLGAWEGPE
jgi:hypothetical protein